MTNEEIVSKAREAYCDDDIEIDYFIDPEKDVSRAEFGAWVRAWVWVDYAEEELPE